MWVRYLKPNMTEEHSGQRDSAETFGRALTVQQDQIRGLEAPVMSMRGELQGFAAQLNQLTGSLSVNPKPSTPAPPDPAPVPASSVAPPPVPETNSPCPEKFSGDSGDCGGFLFQCSLVFNHSLNLFPHDDSKISYVLRLLTGRALKWAESRFSAYQRFDCSFPEFINEFKMFFSAVSDEVQDSRRLLGIKQHGRRLSDFAVEFRTLAAAASWEQRALKTVFFQAVDEPLKDELACLEEPAILNELISLAIRLDNQIRSRSRGRMERPLPVRAPLPERNPSRPSLAPPSPPEPMQLGRVRLSQTERQQCMEARLCIYCASPDHYIASCPERPKDSARRV
uniref:Ty3 transposon capsid-like protein domain-containing protein n=1 Tax=Fundulus heteroclitus TaxID=8078 RepID=A0A3Q2NY42_FUNHE